MQYPIIDLITDAYINNGWTGLDISTGKNLFNQSIIQGGVAFDTGAVLQITNRLRNVTFIDLYSGQYTISYNPSNIELVGYVYNNHVFDEQYSFRNEWNSQPFTFSVPYDFNIIFAFRYPSNSWIVPNDIDNIQIEIGSEATPYEPYSEPKNDFPNRLKLPLPHYFPHPVIDALQRAAAGTQTADDTEILRHYLIPLGIGGI